VRRAKREPDRAKPQEKAQVFKQKCRFRGPRPAKAGAYEALCIASQICLTY
jgi:hypothetical protein